MEEVKSNSDSCKKIVSTFLASLLLVGCKLRLPENGLLDAGKKAIEDDWSAKVWLSFDNDSDTPSLRYSIGGDLLGSDSSWLDKKERKGVYDW